MTFFFFAVFMDRVGPGLWGREEKKKEGKEGVFFFFCSFLLSQRFQAHISFLLSPLLSLLLFETERFDLRLPYVDNGWVDEDADFFKQIGRFFGGGKKKEGGDDEQKGGKKGGRK